MKYQIWDGRSPVKCPLKSFTKEEFINEFPFAQNQKVLLGIQGDTAVEVSNLNIVLGNFGIQTTDETDEEIAERINQAYQAIRQEQKDANLREKQEKADALEDQYLRDCNNELAVLIALPDVEPRQAPKRLNTIKFRNYKWNYDNGFWDEPILELVVRKGQLSLQEYEEITGEVYTVNR